MGLLDRLNDAAGGGDGSAPASNAPAAPTGSLIDKLNNAGANSASPPPPPPPPPPPNSVWYDIFHPQPADLSQPQTWRDWATKTYSPSASDVGRSALDDVSFGTADPIQSAMTGEDIKAIRARTAASQAALGPMGPVLNAATYAAPGLGEAKAAFVPGRAIGMIAQKAAPALGRYGAAALEGGTAAGLSSVGHRAGGDIDPWRVAQDMATGAVLGTAGQAVGDVTAPVAQRVADYVTGKPGLPNSSLRQAYNAGQDIRPDIAAAQTSVRPGSAPAQALDNLNSAVGMSTEPGPLSNLAKRGAGIAGAGFGWEHGGSLLEALGGLAGGDVVGRWGIDPIARGLNTIDRNINVSQAFGNLYPGTTTNIKPWADALRQLSIGSFK